MNLYLLIEDSFSSGGTRQAYADKIKTAITDFDAVTDNCDSNYAIAKCVHDTIIDNIDYAFSEDGVTPKDNIYVHNITSYVAEEKEAVCDGYAKTYQAVLNYLDIDTIFVNGWGVAQGTETSNATAHAWNMVKLGDGNYYFVDVTWDDTGSNGSRSDYFCIGKEIYDDHSILQNGASEGNYFLYHLPDVTYTSFSGTDTLVKEADPEYIIMNTIHYELEDGVMTFTGRGSIQQPEEYMDGEWCQYKDQVTKLVFSEGITFIGNFTFKKFDKVTEISFPDSLTGIGQQAFDGCTSLTEVVLPDGISFYDSEIFARCTALTKITFGKFSNESFIYANVNMFNGSMNLETIIVPEEHSVLASIDNVLIDKGTGNIIAYAAGKKDTCYEIPETIHTIGVSAFSYCDHLEEVIIPDSVEKIGSMAFNNCNSLKSISFPASVSQFYLSEANADFENVIFCKNIQYIENKSDAIMKLSTEYCYDKDDSKYWKYWQDPDTGKLISELANGTAIPKYYGRISSKGEYIVAEGITYLVISEDQAALSVSEINAGAAIGKVSAVSADDTITANDTIPEKIEYNGWLYEVAEISEDVLAVLKKDPQAGTPQGPSQDNQNTQTTPSSQKTTASQNTTTSKNTEKSTKTTKKQFKLSNVKRKKGTKKITGKVSVKNAVVKIKVGKKKYKKAAVSGKKFVLKQTTKLKKGTVIYIKVTKKGYKTLTKKYKVK